MTLKAMGQEETPRDSVLVGRRDSRTEPSSQGGRQEGGWESRASTMFQQEGSDHVKCC